MNVKGIFDVILKTVKTSDEKLIRHTIEHYNQLFTRIPIHPKHPDLKNYGLFDLRDNSFKFVSPAAGLLHSCRNTDIMKNPFGVFYNTVHTNDLQRFLEEWDQVFNRRKVRSITTRFVKQDGSGDVVWIKRHTQYIYNRKGEPIFYELRLEDVTQRKMNRFWVFQTKSCKTHCHMIPEWSSVECEPLEYEPLEIIEMGGAA